MDRSIREARLTELRFGEDVAEHDAALGEHFLRNGAYWSIVQDESDLILGAKGSGKSAIARYLSDPEAHIPQLDDTDIVPAFNIRGSVLFRRLTESVDWHSVDFRDLFYVYMAAVVGNHLHKTYGDSHDTKDILASLKTSGLLVEDPTIQGIWRQAISRLRPKSLQANVTLSASPSASVVGTLEAQEEQVGASPHPQVEAILDASHTFLERLGRRCWIVFDRLDEAFPESPDLESSALRGLMQAHLDLSSYGPLVKSKLFLRIDVLDRVTRRVRFVNASHIRTFRILWDTATILHMIALRADRDLAISGEVSGSRVRSIVRDLMPQKMDGQEALVWLLVVTADGFREFNPRNVLYLLRTARLAALQNVGRVVSETLIDHESLHSGYRQLSVARLQDTVIAESPGLREQIEALRGRRANFKRGDLEDLLGVAGEDLTRYITALVDIGILRVANRDEWVIPAIYKYAMFRSTHETTPALAGAETREVADLMAHADLTSQHSVIMTDNPDQHTPESARTPDQDAGRRRQRRRGKKKPSPASGRDELVPSGQGSEIKDDLDVAEELTTQLTPEPRPATQRHTSTRRQRNGPRFLPAPVVSAEDAAQIQARRAAVHTAAQLAEEGSVVSAFEILHPKWTSHKGVACVAADLAFRSGDRGLERIARDFLASPGLRDAAPIAARRFALAVSDNSPLEDDRLVGLAKSKYTDGRDGREFVAGLVKMLSQAPSREVEFWVTSGARVRRIQDRRPAYWNAWQLLAMSRMLPVFRFWHQADPGRYFTLRELVDEVVPEDEFGPLVPKLEGYLYSYAAQPREIFPAMLPYQALSTAAVLEAKAKLSDNLRQSVVTTMTRELSVAEPEHVEHFRAWSSYTGLAGEVVMFLADETVEPRSEMPSRVERLHTAELHHVAQQPRLVRDRGPRPEVLAAVRNFVTAAGSPVPGARAAHAALAVDPNLARTGWSGSGKFSQFLIDYLPELRYIPSPTPGWVLDPAVSDEGDIPQYVARPAPANERQHSADSSSAGADDGTSIAGAGG